MSKSRPNQTETYETLGNEDTGDKTELLTGAQETLKKELQKAKQQEACLIVIRGPQQGHRYFLTQAEMIVGRDVNADISITDKSISRKQAKIFKADGKVLISDLGSANGTIINGTRIEKESARSLGKEDMVQLGNVILKFVPAGEYEILFYGDMDSKAYTDPLTTISNKRYLEERLEAEFKRAKALGDDLAVVFFDLDHFKKLNDTHGHAAGDYVLREIASVIRAQFVGPKDVFARYGGEEFVLAFVNTSVVRAAEIAENIRLAVETHNFMYDGKRLPVTISMGVAQLSNQTENTMSLLKLADQAAYQSKNQGRNTVTAIS